MIITRNIQILILNFVIEDNSSKFTEHRMSNEKLSRIHQFSLSFNCYEIISKICFLNKHIKYDTRINDTYKIL